MLTPPGEDQFDILYEQVTQQSHRTPMNYMKNYTIKNVVRFSHVSEGRYGNRRGFRQVFHDWKDGCPWRTGFGVQADIRRDPPISNAQVIVGPTIDNPNFSYHWISFEDFGTFWRRRRPTVQKQEAYDSGAQILLSLTEQKPMNRATCDQKASSPFCELRMGRDEDPICRTCADRFNGLNAQHDEVL
jgi:hypothetical protein